MNIPAACSGILEQLVQLVEELTPEEFSKPAAVLGNYSVGQHIRHTLEFFICLEAGDQSGSVNYDKREHNKLIETDKFLALNILHRIQQYVNKPRDNQAVNLEITYGTDSGQVHQVPSNFMRELVYNIEHAVHHMALIKIGVREVAPHINLPPDFGVASSTLRHQQKISSATA